MSILLLGILFVCAISFVVRFLHFGKFQIAPVANLYQRKENQNWFWCDLLFLWIWVRCGCSYVIFDIDFANRSFKLYGNILEWCAVHWLGYERNRTGRMGQLNPILEMVTSVKRGWGSVSSSMALCALIWSMNKYRVNQKLLENWFSSAAGMAGKTLGAQAVFLL